MLLFFDNDCYYTVVLPWSVSDYNMHLPARPNGFFGSLEETMESLFPPLFPRPFPMVDSPCVIMDNNAIIIYWYLPGCLTLSRQVSQGSSMYFTYVDIKVTAGHMGCNIPSSALSARKEGSRQLEDSGPFLPVR